jgi:ATP-dependent Clp protease ATP-binding subunit ClpC
VLGARPLRRTIQREIEDALSEKILFDEVGPGQLVSVDVDNWDGESNNIEDAVFTFVGNRRAAADADAGADPALAGAPGAGGTPTAAATE